MEDVEFCEGAVDERVIEGKLRSAFPDCRHHTLFLGLAMVGEGQMKGGPGVVSWLPSSKGQGASFLGWLPYPGAVVA